MAMSNAARNQNVSDGGDEIAIDVVTDRSAALAMLDDIGPDHCLTGYQHPAFLRAWIEAGQSEPIFVVLAAQGHGPVLLPLQRGSGHSAHYVGGRHANGNFPLGKPEDIAALGDDATDFLSAHPALTAADIHTLILERQHGHWNGVANPFVNEGSVRSPNVALSLNLRTDFDEVLANCPGSRKRKKFRSQMRKLEAAGPVETVIPVKTEERQRVLEQFFDFKTDRFREVGIADVFADEPTRAAFTEMFAGQRSDKDTVHELHLLKVDDEPAAITGCTVYNGRLTVEFSTFNPKFSNAGPGELLFFLAIENAVERRLNVFDFGVGDETYKRSWCDVETWHHDTFIAITGRGQLNRIARTMRSELVRKLKSNDPLWKAAKAARKKLASVKQ